MRKLFAMILVAAILCTVVGFAARLIVDGKVIKTIQSNTLIQNNSWMIETALNGIQIDGMKKTGTVNERIASLVTPGTAQKLMNEGIQITGGKRITLQELIDGVSIGSVEFNLTTMLKGRVPQFVIDHLHSFVWLYAYSTTMKIGGAIAAVVSLLLMILSPKKRRS